MSLKVSIETNKGNINLELFPDKAPITVASFVNLIQRGYYNGLYFHRVIKNFMIQTGCPMGIGSGGPGYEFVDETRDDLNHDKPGILSMAKPQRPNSNGSQFFITHTPTPHLDGVHTVFGEVCSEDDQAVVNQIVQGDQMIQVTVSGDVQGILSKQKDNIDNWNKILSEKFPHLN